jgi:hypothetical protein
VTKIWRRPITGRWHMFRHDGVHFVEGVGHWASRCSPQACGEMPSKLYPLWRCVWEWLSNQAFMWRWRIRHWRWR